MDEVTWTRLPEEIMAMILSRLTIPILIRLKVVCKQWNILISSTNSAFQRLATDVPVSFTPAFLIELRYMSFWNRPMTIFTTTLWMVEGRNCKIYRLPLDFLPSPVNVIAVCKSTVLCCKHNGVKQSPAMYVCNPAIRTWRQLPSPNRLNWWDFVALSFGSAARRCRIVLGRGSIKAGDQQADMEIEMYDSFTNSWTKLDICIGTAQVCPRGEGIYSKERFYWINATDNGSTKGDVVVFNVEDGSWQIIERPRDVAVNREVLASWCLSGVDGRIILVNKYKDLCMWRLKEDSGDESRKKLWRWVVEIEGSECDVTTESCQDAAMNESGWSLVYLATKNGMVILDEKRKTVKKIDKREAMKIKMVAEDGTCPTCVRAFEVNNVWWP